MKKTMIIALFAVLVLSVFTACNGDVNADMADKKTITLEIESNVDTWTFSDGSKTAVKEIPEGCATWGDLVNKGFSINTKKGSDSFEWTLFAENDQAWFLDEAGLRVAVTEDKAMYSILLTTPVNSGEIYTVYIYEYL